MVLIYIASVIISLITLICFWVLCFNVSIIKKHLQEDDKWLLIQKFNRAKAFGDMDEARDCLKQIIWAEVQEINNDTTGVEARIARYNLVEKNSMEALNELGLVFPNKELCAKS